MGCASSVLFRSGLSSGRWGGRPPTAGTEPCVRLSPPTAPQPMGCCHQHHNCCGLVNVPVELENLLRSSVHPQASAIRLKLRKPFNLTIDRPHVSVSLALPRALASWGIPPTDGLRLAACSGCPESCQRVTPFRASIFRGFRSVLYAASLDPSGYLVPLDNVAEGDDSHFGPACQLIWQGLHDDASNVPSLALTMITCSAHRRVRIAAYRLSLHALRRLRASHPPLEGAVTCPPQG